MKWKLEENNQIGNSGASNANIATLDPSIAVLVRETIQNSYDARVDNAKLVMNFEIIEFPTSDFIYFDDYKNSVNQVNDFLVENEKNDNKHFLKVFCNNIPETCRAMVISDYNTTGAHNRGHHNTPWQALVYDQGNSIKQSDEAAGNFGIGKNIVYNFSDARTALYSSYSEGEIEYEGVFFGTSTFINEKSYVDKSYMHIDSKDKNLPYNNEIINFYRNTLNIIRNENGTDVVIPFYNGPETTASEILMEIAWNFFVAILEDNISITVCGTELNKDTILDVIGGHSNCFDDKKVQQLYSLIKLYNEQEYQVVEYGKDKILYKLEFENDNSDKTFDKRIYHIRKNEMRLAYNIKQVPRKFLLIVKYDGSEINQIIKNSEDPQHEKFKQERLLNKDDKRKFVEIDRIITGLIKPPIDLNTTKLVPSAFTAMFEPQKEKAKNRTLISKKKTHNTETTDEKKQKKGNGNKKKQGIGDIGIVNLPSGTKVAGNSNLSEAIKFRKAGKKLYVIKLNNDVVTATIMIRRLITEDGSRSERYSDFVATDAHVNEDNLIKYIGNEIFISTNDNSSIYPIAVETIKEDNE